MNKVKTLANQNYYILEEDDQFNNVLESMKIGDYLGSKQPIQDERLVLDNTCYRMKKSLKEISSNLEYKIAKIRDAKDIARILNKNMVEVPNTVEYKKRFVEILINGGYNEFYYILDDGDIIGLVELCFEEDIPEITSIVVLPKYRNQGYGKRILSLVENKLKKNYDEVTIVVSDHNEIAYHLYEKQGYQKEETVMYYYRRLS